MRRQRLFALMSLVLSVLGVLLAAEVLLRCFYPQESMFPRWQFSPRYCTLLYENTTMLHERPGRWRFHYTTNEYQYRGAAVPISNVYERRNLVVLGDSYTFGHGVDDGEEYPAILAGELKEGFDVVNLGVGGWGLTQEIRRFYEFGVLYRPRAVVLQFSANDPRDDLVCPVTTVEKGRFVFHDRQAGIHWIKQYLSRSWIQKSQVYNLFRDAVYRHFEAKVVEGAQGAAVGKPEETEGAREETLYADLLDAFARDLGRAGIPLILLSVNGQMHTFPRIEKQALELQSQGLLRYVDAARWLAKETDYASPEGHLWGKKAHRIIGSRLAAMIREESLR